MGTVPLARFASTAAALVLAAALAGCGTMIAGTPSPGDGIAVQKVDTSFIEGSDGGRIDQLAAATDEQVTVQSVLQLLGAVVADPDLVVFRPLGSPSDPWEGLSAVKERGTPVAVLGGEQHGTIEPAREEHRRAAGRRPALSGPALVRLMVGHLSPS